MSEGDMPIFTYVKQLCSTAMQRNASEIECTLLYSFEVMEKASFHLM